MNFEIMNKYVKHSEKYIVAILTEIKLISSLR